MLYVGMKVYVKAKECGDRLSVEEFAILIGKHFCSFYPQVCMHYALSPYLF